MKALEVGEVNDPCKGITEKDIFTPGSAEDITVALEDTLLNSPTIAGSRFVHRIWGKSGRKTCSSSRRSST